MITPTDRYGADYGSSPRTWGGWRILPGSHQGRDGSSPRTWGGCQRAVAHLCQGPVHPHARGADSSESESTFFPISVHPHARGADISQQPTDSATAAVHPHARGADDGQRNHIAVHSRFIPTHVGRMIPRAGTASTSPTVHPHARGADVFRVQTVIRVDAVHPHARGADGAALRGVVGT